MYVAVAAIFTSKLNQFWMLCQLSLYKKVHSNLFMSYFANKHKHQQKHPSAFALRGKSILLEEEKKMACP